MTGLLRLLAPLAVLLCVLAGPVEAQEVPLGASVSLVSLVDPDAAATGGDDLTGEDAQLSTAVEVALLLTVLSLIPAILISLTSFTRIVIVLSFVRRSLAVQELPPNPIIIGLALFLTTFVMGPVFVDVYDEAYTPYREGRMEMEEASGRAWESMSGFLLANTRQEELDLFVELAELEPMEAGAAAPDLPFRVIVPAFVLSELKTAFQMGFLLFLPFLVIDLVVASVLISMGMFMLPPVMISTPFKILLFVLVDGWRLVCESLVTSFVL
jgi:flagellar biosynthetic protein FliP